MGVTCKLHERDYRLWCDECHDRAEDPAVRVIVNLRVRLAEVEAERDMWQQRAHNVGVRGQEDYERAEAAEARLAEAEAERDALEGEVAEYRKRRDADLVTIHELNTQLVSHDCLTELADAEARAAARGEGDRPGVPADLLRAVARWRESDGDVLYSKCPHCGTVLTVPDRQLVVCCNGFRVDRRHLKPAPEITGMGGEGDRPATHRLDGTPNLRHIAHPAGDGSGEADRPAQDTLLPDGRRMTADWPPSAALILRDSGEGDRG